MSIFIRLRATLIAPVLLSARLLAVVTLVWAIATPAFAQRVALVMGNGAYAHIPVLPNPRNDANAIGERLSGIGFDVRVVIDADLGTMRAAIDDFAQRARGAETALVFYAGHGLQVGGQNYLLPVDTRLRNRSDLAAAALGVDALFDAFNRAGADTAILILDACRDNPFAETIGAEQGLTSGMVSSRSIGSRPNSAGVVIAFAAAPGSVASDGANGNSPYTTALLKWIDRPGLELATMLRRVRGTVLQLTNGTQVPWVEEALVRDVYLNPGPVEVARSDERIEVSLLNRIRGFEPGSEQTAAQTFYDRYLVNASLDGGTTADMDERFVREGLTWLSIRQSTAPDVFEAFIAEFPEGPFAELARDRLQTLIAQPQPQVLAWLDDLPPVPPRPQVQPAPEPLDAGATGEGSAPVIAEVETPREPTPAEIEQSLGLSEAERAAVQRLLREAGFYRGALDADYGPGTRGGIAEFQVDADLPRTGYLDVDTLRQLVARTAPAVLMQAEDAERHDEIHRVAAVAARGPGSEPEVIRVEAMSRNDTVHAYWREIADEFEANTPGTLVEINHRPGGQYLAELMSILGSETPPDILYTWSGGHLDALREAGFARDLTEDMAEGWAFEFKPGALQNYTHEGRIHGVPMHLALISLYANTAVFERAGISMDRLETWEGFLEVVQEFREKGIVPLAVGGGERWPIGVYFSALAQRLAGGEAVAAALAGEGEGFAGPAFEEAAREFDRLTDLAPFQPDYLSMDDGQAVEVFARGEAAMVVTGSWRLEKMHWAWPGGPDRMAAELVQLGFPVIGEFAQEPMTYGGVDGFSVSVDAPDAAVAFLRRLTAIDVQQRMAEIASDIPTFPGADLAIESDFLREASRRVLSSTYHQLYLDQELGPEVGQLLNEAMVQLATGSIGPKEALAVIDDSWDEHLAERR
jgi:raffinose/stachyose/melibiose transport system substrate-binding protein